MAVLINNAIPLEWPMQFLEQHNSYPFDKIKWPGLLTAQELKVVWTCN